MHEPKDGLIRLGNALYVTDKVNSYGACAHGAVGLCFAALYAIKVSFWGSGTLKIVIPVPSHDPPGPETQHSVGCVSPPSVEVGGC